MERADALKKARSLSLMTVEKGCFPQEASNAQALLTKLKESHNLTDDEIAGNPTRNRNWNPTQRYPHDRTTGFSWNSTSYHFYSSPPPPQPDPRHVQEEFAAAIRTGNAVTKEIDELAAQFGEMGWSWEGATRHDGTFFTFQAIHREKGMMMMGSGRFEGANVQSTFVTGTDTPGWVHRLGPIFGYRYNVHKNATARRTRMFSDREHFIQDVQEITEKGFN